MRILIPDSFRFEPDVVPDRADYDEFRARNARDLEIEIACRVAGEQARILESAWPRLLLIGAYGLLLFLSVGLALLLKKLTDGYGNSVVVLLVIGFCALLGFLGTLFAAGLTQGAYRAMLRKKKRFLLAVVDLARRSADYREFSARYRRLAARR